MADIDKKYGQDLAVICARHEEHYQRICRENSPGTISTTGSPPFTTTTQTTPTPEDPSHPAYVAMVTGGIDPVVLCVIVSLVVVFVILCLVVIFKFRTQVLANCLMCLKHNNRALVATTRATSRHVNGPTSPAEVSLLHRSPGGQPSSSGGDTVIVSMRSDTDASAKDEPSAVELRDHATFYVDDKRSSYNSNSVDSNIQLGETVDTRV